MQEQRTTKKKVVRLKFPSIDKTITKKMGSFGFLNQKHGANRPKHISSLVRQAEELRSKLEAKYPSFKKVLVKSHVSGCFWMGLPLPFCKMHLPQEDTYFILENQNGKQYEAKYLADRTALSGGWRGFSIAEKLLEGDVLVFQLVNPTKFKTYRLRETDCAEVNRTHAKQNLGTELDQIEPNLDCGTVEQNRTMCQATAESQERDCQVLTGDDHRIAHPEGTGQKIRSDINSGNRKHSQVSPAVVGYSGIASFEDFLALKDELLKKDYELPDHIKWNYYQLCSSQNELLHVHLLKGTSPVLVAGSIIDTVNVADAIKNCELSTFDNKFATWNRKLKYLEVLGMKVDFLRAHLYRLQGIAHDPEVAKITQQYVYQSSEHAESLNKIKNLHAEFTELLSVYETRADKIKELEAEITKHELRFQEQVSAPW